MVRHMKTTVEISDSLLKEAQDLARRNKTTLRALLESGLRRELAQRSQRADFHLPDASVGGQGMNVEFQGAGWEQVREAAYGDRG